MLAEQLKPEGVGKNLQAVRQVKSRPVLRKRFNECPAYPGGNVRSR
jgi:hypothetical protein